MKHSPSSSAPVVLFDLDGTLAHSLESGLKVANHLRHLFGYEKMHPDDERLRRYSGHDFVSKVLKLGSVKGFLWGMAIKTLAPLNAAQIPLHEGAGQLLHKLHKRRRIGILSSAPRFYVRTILRNGNVPPLEWELAGISYLGKAHALRRFMRTEGFLPREIIYVGDEVRDGIACREAQVPFIAVSWGKDHPDLFAAAGFDRVAEDMDELFRMIQNT